MEMRKQRRQRGAALVLVLLSLLALIGMVGFAIDWTMIVLTGQQLQAGADASALAAAARMGNSLPGAHQTALDVALENIAARAPIQLAPNPTNDPGGDIVFGVYDRAARVFTPTTTDPNAVKVVARRTEDSPAGATPLFFGHVFGRNTADVGMFAMR